MQAAEEALSQCTMASLVARGSFVILLLMVATGGQRALVQALGPVEESNFRIFWMSRVIEKRDLQSGLVRGLFQCACWCLQQPDCNGLASRTDHPDSVYSTWCEIFELDRRFLLPPTSGVRNMYLGAVADYGKSIHSVDCNYIIRTFSQISFDKKKKKKNQ